MISKKRIASVALILAAILINIYVIFGSDTGINSWVLKALICLGVDAVFLYGAFSIDTLISVPKEIYREKDVFWMLTKNDFKARFAGSYLGLFWAFFQPVITILLYWFVFQVGLRNGDVSNHPFILYLMSGLVPWFFFSEAWMGATNSLIEYNYLVKKVRFNMEMLPVLKVASALFVHVFFVSVVVVVCLIYGYGPDLYLLQIIYYILCLSFLAIGLSYITSACTVFFRDMTQIVNIMLTIGVWLTPIMWNLETIMTPALQKIFKLNPVYYVVDGFRDSLLDKVWVFEKPMWSIFFWCVSIGLFIIGTKIFNKLKAHFSDVL